ncbi:hypothetical protein EDD15DRAFT_2317681 [Pisolithus albus]|nr:hypothetical protein EDD15DRAFT_2317681 [Pisolithus albus]
MVAVLIILDCYSLFVFNFALGGSLAVQYRDVLWRLRNLFSTCQVTFVYDEDAPTHDTYFGCGKCRVEAFKCFEQVREQNENDRPGWMASGAATTPPDRGTFDAAETEGGMQEGQTVMRKGKNRAIPSGSCSSLIVLLYCVQVWMVTCAYNFLRTDIDINEGAYLESRRTHASAETSCARSSAIQALLFLRWRVLIIEYGS